MSDGFVKALGKAIKLTKQCQNKSSIVHIYLKTASEGNKTQILSLLTENISAFPKGESPVAGRSMGL